MAQAKIHAGACGFSTIVTATPEGRRKVQLKIESECPNIKRLESELTEVDINEEYKAKIGAGKVYETFRKYCPHVSCPVTSGVLKAMEVACGFNLPKDAKIEVSK